MELMMVGLGKMGANMTRRLQQGGHQVIGYDRDEKVVRELAAESGMIPAFSMEEAVEQLEGERRVAWSMVPAGPPTEAVVRGLADLLDEGDIIIDGGNSNSKETMRRAAMLQEAGRLMVDVGTSGGVWGLTGGYSMMVGGSDEAVNHVQPILETLAPARDKGWGHVGSNGAGHFVKMIHNGIEYGIMQAYAEGFDIMRAKDEFDLDMHQIADIWRFGSVIRSWLLDLIALALEEDVELSDIMGYVPDSGEGRWTVLEAIALDIPAPIITLSLMARFTSRQEESYAAKMLAAMRNQFGGHAVRRAQPGT
ncbi:MAG: decarboxylating 6-phosphogluconate dehydrogenase [Candidatus Promineifilaceae bacterium]|nr:decarboxylating 6-phosphogluconate dehydrogenase [Candidatus Promineifilaceae bacterium]